jgi:hypothetical protein
MTHEKINAIAELIVAGASPDIERAWPDVTTNESATAAIVAFSSREADSTEQARADFADHLIALLNRPRCSGHSRQCASRRTARFFIVLWAVGFRGLPPPLSEVQMQRLSHGALTSCCLHLVPRPLHREIREGGGPSD